MDAKSILEKFKRQRELLTNLIVNTAKPRLKGMWYFLNSKAEMVSIISKILPVVHLVAKAGPNNPIEASTYDEIVGVGLYIMRKCGESNKNINVIMNNLGLSIENPTKGESQLRVNDLMKSFIDPVLIFIENKLEELAKTESKAKSTEGDTNKITAGQTNEKQTKNEKGKSGKGVYGSEEREDREDADQLISEVLDGQKRLLAKFKEFLVTQKGVPENEIVEERVWVDEIRPLDIDVLFIREGDKTLAIIEYYFFESNLKKPDREQKLLKKYKEQIKLEDCPAYIACLAPGKKGRLVDIYRVTESEQPVHISNDDFPTYEELRRKRGKETEAPEGEEGGNKKVFQDDLDLRIAFEKYLVNEKGCTPENYSTEDYADEYAVTRILDNEQKVLALIAFCLERSGADKAFEGIKEHKERRGISGVPNYVIFANEDQKIPFAMLEYEDNETATEILKEDFPTYKQLLFASPLSDRGRRICWALTRFAKDEHGFSVDTPCEDYVNLKIKKNGRTAAQIHRVNDSDENIALALAGYQEDFPDTQSSPYLLRGEVEQLSGYTSKSQGERNWLEGNLGHAKLIYKAGVYVLRPGALVLGEVEDEVGELLKLARKNAGGGIIKGIVSKIMKVFGRIATLRSDEVSDVDDLGRETLIDAFADTMMHTEFSNGFTLALMGNWGEGKSSVMEILKRKLKEQKKGRFDFALFNAWEYEQTGKTAAGLAQEVVKGLREKNFFKRQLQRVAFAYKENKLSLVIPFCLLISPFLLYLLRHYYDLTLLTDYLNNKPELKKLFGDFINAIYVILPLFGIHIFKKNTEHPLDIKLQTYFKLPDYGEHLGLIPVLKRHITTLCKLKLNTIRIPFTKIKIGKDRKLLVFVDDLDRCKSGYIAETLDAIRLVMTIPNVIVMICIDHRIAFKAIEKHYRTLAEVEEEEEDGSRRSSAEVARDYLGKIIQLPVRLEPVKHEKLKNYVYGKLFRFKKVEWQDFGEAVELPTVSPPTYIKSMEINKATEHNTLEEDKQKTVGLADKGKVSDANALKAKGKKSKQGRKIDDKKSHDKVIEDTPEEGKEFYRLAGLFEFTNPRQLLRLHNSFRFLKALGRGGEGDTLDVLRMLFWQEFLHNWPVKIRGRCMAALIYEVEKEKLAPTVRGVVGKVRGDIVRLFNGDNYTELAEFVRIVVLPHNEEGIFDTKEDINEWLKKEKEAEEKEASKKTIAGE